MTDKQKISIVTFVIAVIVSAGFGWNWFLTFNGCNQDNNNISRLMDNQDNLLYTYGFFAEQSLKEDMRESFKKLIEIKEPLIKASVENFKKTCRSGLRKNQLGFMLKNYQTYLVTKQTLFKESQQSGFNWIRDNVPIDPSVYDID